MEYFLEYLVCRGVRACAEDRGSILAVQNPTLQKRGGLSFGMYALVNARGDPKARMVNVDLYSPMSQSSEIALVRRGEREFGLSLAGEVVATGRFFLPPAWTTRRTTNGMPMGTIFQQHTPGNLVGVVGATRCSLFDQGNACSFCHMSGGTDNSARRLEDMLEALPLILQENPGYHLTLTTPLLDEDQVAEVIRQIRIIKERHPALAIALEIQPLQPSQVVALKSAGLDTLMVPVDCVTEKSRQKYVPGKAALLKKLYWECVTQGVETFGVGNMVSGVIIGLDPLDRTLSFIRRMIDEGVIPEVLPIRLHREVRGHPLTAPEDLARAKESLAGYMRDTGFAQRMESPVKSGCAACGACSGDFSVNRNLKEGS